MAADAAPLRRYAQCQAVLDDPARPFFPLTFVRADGKEVCPDCIPVRPLSPTLAMVTGGQATRPQAAIVDRRHPRAWPGN